MATRKRLLHIKSDQKSANSLYGVIEQPKLPEVDVLGYGEIAVNYGADTETISIKNNKEGGNEIVTFSSDKALYDVEETVVSAIADITDRIEALESKTPDVDDELDLESENPVQNKVITEALDEIEEVSAAAFNDLNGRLNNTYTKEEVDELLTNVDIDVDDTLDDESENPVQNKVITDVISEIEIVTSAALNDLNDRKLDSDVAEATYATITNTYTKTEVDELMGEYAPQATTYTKTEVDELIENIEIDVDDELDLESENPVQNKVISGRIHDIELVTSAALNDLNDKITAVSDSTSTLANGIYYDSNSKRIYLMNGDTNLNGIYAYVDATDFIKDGMVDSVTVGTPTEGTHARTECLIITFNTDAGKENIEIPINDIFDSSQYYTKNEVERLLSEKQDTLVDSGANQNLKTVFGTSLLGTGDVPMPAADTTNLGGVIVGTDLAVGRDGKLMVQKETALTENTASSTKPITTKAVYDTIADVELVVSSALNDLNDRIIMANQEDVRLEQKIDQHEDELSNLFDLVGDTLYIN